LFQVAVFSVDRILLNEIAAAASRNEDMTRFKGRSTLALIQSISCLPAAYPTHLNTCGRICVHKSGRFVVVSNRGHESLAILRVKTKGSEKGKLQAVGYFHTRGETPRHFQFDSSGQFLIVANQDSDSIAVFSFNLSTGQIKFTGNDYRVPSPNFVCSCPTYQEDDSMSVTLIEREDIKRLEYTTQSGVESDSESSDNSTVRVKSAFHGKSKDDALQQELFKAREEIELLKRQLQSMQTI
jgi:6-phosphogluconolactonase